VGALPGDRGAARGQHPRHRSSLHRAPPLAGRRRSVCCARGRCARVDARRLSCVSQDSRLCRRLIVVVFLLKYYNDLSTTFCTFCARGIDFGFGQGMVAVMSTRLAAAAARICWLAAGDGGSESIDTSVGGGVVAAVGGVDVFVAVDVVFVAAVVVVAAAAAVGVSTRRATSVSS
jgi:hypothetical protein